MECAGCGREVAAGFTCGCLEGGEMESKVKFDLGVNNKTGRFYFFVMEVGCGVGLSGLGFLGWAWFFVLVQVCLHLRKKTRKGISSIQQLLFYSVVISSHTLTNNDPRGTKKA